MNTVYKKKPNLTKNSNTFAAKLGSNILYTWNRFHFLWNKHTWLSLQYCLKKLCDNFNLQQFMYNSN